MSKYAKETFVKMDKAQIKVKRLMDAYSDPFKFTHHDKPVEVDRQIIVAIDQLKRCKMGKLQKIFGPNYDVENADWSDMLVPHSHS